MSALPLNESGAPPAAASLSVTNLAASSLAGDQRPHSAPSSRAGYPANVARNLTYPNYPAWGLLERAAAEVPERVATSLFHHEMTYAEVNWGAKRLASALQHAGLAPGERVAVLLPNMPEYVVALHGIWRAGGVVVALSPLAVPAEIAAQLKNTDCRRVICLDLLLGLLNEATAVQHHLVVSLRGYLPWWKRCLYSAALWRKSTRSPSLGHRRATVVERSDFWQALARAPQTFAPAETLPAQDPAYILSTGGTTGNPKAVTLSHRNIVANAWQQAHWAGASLGQEIMLACLPFFHSYGMSTMVASGAALGATLILLPRFDAGQVLRAIEQQRPTVFHAVPAMLHAMNLQLRKHPRNLRSLKWVISGGAPLAPAVAEEFSMHSGAIVVQGYGLSEASPVTHVGPLDGSNLPGSIGLPLPDTDCRIVDTETGVRDLPAGEVGELLIRGPQVMLGYWNNPSATQATVRDGWLHTGDLATVDVQGFYRIVDRKKDLIITSGFNVYPADVEEVLRGCEMIADVAVVGVPDELRGEVVKAYVVLRAGHTWRPDRLQKFCQQHLAAHRRPRVWEQVHGDLPRNFLGKVLRRQLRAPA